ncbi:MAG: serine/threonine-protein kinase [Maritimibacter sp.]
MSGEDDNDDINPPDESAQGEAPEQDSPPAQAPKDAPDAERTMFAPMSGLTDAPVSSEPPLEAVDPENDRTQIATHVPPIAPIAQPKTAAVIPAASGGAQAVTVGSIINNNYEITDVLKSGGMGEVYRGREIGTGDPVAIKAILPELAEDEKAGLLFKREARTLRQLADEAIVRYYNYVHDRDLDRYFLVMEFIEGVPLSDHIETHGAIPAAAAQTLLKRLAKGLGKAHEQDVVHRDLSPDNVMLPGGLVGEARLIDFGIAKSNVVTEGTMHGQFAGKFKYVAPEQLGHYDGIIGPGTDVYGLALLIAAAVIGKPLDMGSSIVEAVQSRQTIPDLSAVPQVLRPILAHMLEPNPADRPLTMDDLRRLLENPHLIPAKYLDGAPPPPPMDVTGRGSMPPIPMPPRPTPGLQMPTHGGVNTTTTGFGATTTTGPTALKPLDEKAERSGGGKLLFGLVAMFVLGLGGAGFYGWNNGLIGSGPTQNTTATPQNTQASTGLPDPIPTSRDGFLALLDTGACSFAARVPAGPNTGMIEGFSDSGNAFAGLPVAYEEKFGARPEVLARQITAQQCAALDFARALQGRGGAPVSMVLPVDELESGQTITAQINTGGAGSVWTVLISPLGAVYNLTDRLSEPVGGARSLGFGLNLAQGAEAAPQLLMTLTSNSPLARAAAAASGADAAILLPQVLDEITSRGGGSSVALSYVLLTPPEPDPDPEPDLPDTEQE